MCSVHRKPTAAACHSSAREACQHLHRSVRSASGRAEARRLVIEQDTPLFYEEYAPHPFADTGLFLASTALQIAWLLPLFVRPSADQQDDDEEKTVGPMEGDEALENSLRELQELSPPIEPDPAQVAYMPTYAACSVLTGEFAFLL